MGTRKASRKGVTLDDVRRIALALPGVVESTSYGTVAFKVKAKLLIRMHDDGDHVVLKTTFMDRDHLVQRWPNEFHYTDHYKNYPYVLARAASVSPARLAEVIRDSWGREAPKSLGTVARERKRREAP